MSELYDLMPGSPQQKHIVDLITAYLKDQVKDPRKTALEVWRITRTKLRPRKPK